MLITVFTGVLTSCGTDQFPQALKKHRATYPETTFSNAHLYLVAYPETVFSNAHLYLVVMCIQ